jgi:hypothetical protein
LVPIVIVLAVMFFFVFLFFFFFFVWLFSRAEIGSDRAMRGVGVKVL